MNALRRERDAADWIHLAASGREGEPPAWPLTRATRREAQLWAREWRRPQAIEWERNGLEEEVALYVRCLRRAESAKATAADRTLVRQLMDSLGLTEPGLRSNRWIIDAAAEERRPAEQSAPPAAPGESVRDRLQIVMGGAS